MKAAPFLEDIYPKNLLYAITIRSPIAKGHLKMIQFPKLPDNYAIITARNIPGENKFCGTNMPVLAFSQLSYKGEPVAILLGPDKIKLEALAAECVVLADEEQPVFSGKKSSHSAELSIETETGNAEREFERDNLIITASYSTGIQDHFYAEPSGAICYYDDEKYDGKKNGDKKKKAAKNSSLSQSLTVRTATQWPYHVKACVAGVLNMDMAYINVFQTSLSLHMDGKLWYPSLIACHAALGAYMTKKPVRLILNREEDFLYSPKRCASNIDIVSAIDKEGRITASKIDISVNLGAYEVNSNEILEQTVIGAKGFYKFDNIKITAKGICANLPPQGPFSGFGISQGLFAIERHVSIAADMVSKDPALWRREYIKGNNVPATLFDIVIKSSDYSRKWAAYESLRKTAQQEPREKNESPRGIGFSAGFQGNGLLYDLDPLLPSNAPAVEATLTKEGRLEIRTSIASSEDYSRIWEKVAMEILPLEKGMIDIIKDNAPDCGPSCASRNITIVTTLFEKCCRQIKTQKTKGIPLPITARKTLKPARNGAPVCFSDPGYACAAVEVSIDIVECTPKIRGVWLGVDGGKIISKNRAKRALIRGAIQALGWAFTENIEYINGELTKSQYDRFSIPSPVEIPPIHIDFFENKSSFPKGIGELPFTCIPSAFLQAVSQAMDHAFKNLPLKRKDIWEMVRIKRY